MGGGTTLQVASVAAATDADAAAAPAADTASDDAAAGDTVCGEVGVLGAAAVAGAVAATDGAAPWTPALHAVAAAIAAAISVPPMAQPVCAVLTRAVKQPRRGCETAALRLVKGVTGVPVGRFTRPAAPAPGQR
jgi:hypothetical protein